MEDKIFVNKYVYFDTERGRFDLTNEAQELIYRKKNLICSYSGASDWINHFMCEVIDFCSGCSPYNYALDSYKHENKLPEVFREDKESVIRFIYQTIEESWSQKAYKFVETIIEEADEI